MNSRISKIPILFGQYIIKAESQTLFRLFLIKLDFIPQTQSQKGGVVLVRRPVLVRRSVLVRHLVLGRDMHQEEGMGMDMHQEEGKGMDTLQAEGMDMVVVVFVILAVLHMERFLEA